MAKSKKDVSAIISALGVLMSIVTALLSAVRKRDGTNEDIYRLATPEGESLIDKIAELIVEAGKPAKILADNCYKVVVDYEKSLADMIAAGKYDYVNSDINAKNFLVTGSGRQEVVIKLVHFGRDMESEAVLKEFESRGLRAATLPELLAFGATYPEKQRDFPVIAFGSVWRSRFGCRSVAYLDDWYAGRGLGLLWIEGGWSDHCRFAAVCK